MSLPLAPPTKMALHHPHHHENDEPSSSAGNDQDEDDLPAAAALADILQDTNTKWSEDIRAALQAVDRESNVDREGTKIVGAMINAGMLSTPIIPRRGRRRGGGGPSDDDERTASTHRKENHNGQGGLDDIKSPGEEQDTNSCIEMALPASMTQHKGRHTLRSFTSRGPSASFKSKLKFVIEDEVDFNDKLITRLSGDANDDNNNKSMSDFSASVNMMDFGVSSRRNSLFSLDASESSVDSITSSCVDSDGFLPWRRHGSRDDASSSSSLYTHLPRGSNSDGALNKSSLSSNRSDASLSNLVDSSGFLGWGESVRHSGFAGDEKGYGKRDDDVADGPSQGVSDEIWRIEDYEGSNDHAKRPGPIHTPFAKIRLLTFLMPGAKSQRPTPVDAPGDKSIKNILLKQERRSTSNEAMLTSAKNRARENAGASSDSNRRKSAFAPLFRKSRKDSDVSTSSDEYYSGPSIHLNREDGVDIGELRRELTLAMRDLRNSPV